MKESGIYMIQSIIKPERIYIGSAIWLDKRWWNHLSDLKRNKHSNGKLQRHYNKYGEGDLQFSIITTCSREELKPINGIIRPEQFFIWAYDPWFNILSIAGSNLGHTPSKETRKKQSIAMSGKPKSIESINKLSARMMGNQYGVGNKYRLGHHPSKETLLNMSLAKLGKTKSLETRNKMGKNFRKPVLQYDKSMGFIKEWDSTASANKLLLINPYNISACLRGKRKTAGGFIWKYKFEKKKAA